MACGECQKRREAAKRRAATMRTTSLRGKVPQKPSEKRAARTSINPRLKIIQQKEQDSPVRCPLCSMLLKRVSRKGHGDLMQCPNPQCGYIRKIR